MFKRAVASVVCLVLTFGNYQPVAAQEFAVSQLPVPGAMVDVSAPFVPLALKGMVIDPKKPLEFQFIVDTGHERFSGDLSSRNSGIRDQAGRLVKYFLAGLTIPENDLWVNLSPYEKDRMVPDALGQTELGRDLLSQDYILKQLTASLIYPEKDLGKEFWQRVYQQAKEQFGTTDIPVNTFNKVWILPDQAQVFENVNGSTGSTSSPQGSSPQGAAYVTKSTLKVMLDEDYVALAHNQTPTRPAFGGAGPLPTPQPMNLKAPQGQPAHALASAIVRQIILPAIEKEVNTGKNFAPLRQIYQALILAKWYKETIKNGLLDAVYTNKKKVAGVNLNDPAVKAQIYERYLQAYKKGVFNYIKEDQTSDGQMTPRKYFSGGITRLEPEHLDRRGRSTDVRSDGAMMNVKVDLEKPKDAAMTTQYSNWQDAPGVILFRRIRDDGTLVVIKLGEGVANADWRTYSNPQMFAGFGSKEFKENVPFSQIIHNKKNQEVAVMVDIGLGNRIRDITIRDLDNAAAYAQGTDGMIGQVPLDEGEQGLVAALKQHLQSGLPELDSQFKRNPPQSFHLSAMPDHTTLIAVVNPAAVLGSSPVAFIRHTSRGIQLLYFGGEIGILKEKQDSAMLGQTPSLIEATSQGGRKDSAMTSVTRRNFLRMAAAAAAVPCFLGCGFSEGNPSTQSLSAQNPSVSNLTPDPEIIAWLRRNVFEDGMPRSFMLPEGQAAQRQFWQSIKGTDPGAEVIERLIINDSLSLYDGAVWLTALAFAGGSDNLKAGDVYVKTLLSGRWGALATIRGYTDPFKYQGKTLGREEALFFRILSPRWEQKDPLDGKTQMPGYPGAPSYNPNLIVWPDWKPITGENAWIMMGALQLADAKARAAAQAVVSLNSDEVKLAQSIIPAFRALTTAIGAILHAPEGTYGKNPDDISNENNASAYAALRMLYQITKDSRYLDMMRGVENYIKRYGRDKNVGVYHRLNNAEANGVLYQGGSYRNGRFTPNVDAFAVDVQTWSILAYSPQTIDEWYGDGAAYQMWKATKYRSGFSQDGKLFGVGYTDSHDIFSGEWTEGAIAATLELTLHYANAHPDWAKETLNDAISMTQGMESLARKRAGQKGYLYVNKDVVIPFGWNGRPVESTASTGWAFYLQNFKNPFVLGGQTRWVELADFVRTVQGIAGTAGAPAALRNQAAAEREPPAQPQSNAIDTLANEQEAMRWINDRRFQLGSGGTTQPYQELLAMKERALPALSRNLLDHNADIETRKWSADLLVGIATKETAPWVKYVILKFQDNVSKDRQSTPSEVWLSGNYVNFDLQDLNNKFGDVISVAPPFKLDKAMGAINRTGGIDLNQINVNRAGKAVEVQFDQAQLDQLMQGGFDGFMPVIINITPIQSPFPLLGIAPPREESLAKG